MPGRRRRQTRGQFLRKARFLEPTLRLLLHRGPSQGPPRRVYRLTAQGDQVLHGWVQDLRQTRRQIGHLVEIYDQHMEQGDGEHH